MFPKDRSPLQGQETKQNSWTVKWLECMAPNCAYICAYFVDINNDIFIVLFAIKVLKDEQHFQQSADGMTTINLYHRRADYSNSIPSITSL